MREWLEDRVAYIRGLKSPNDHQRLLLLLNDKKDATDDDRRKLVALIRAEKAAEKAQRAKASVAKIVNAEKEAERKRRNHDLYESGGLLILAGLVTPKRANRPSTVANCWARSWDSRRCPPTMPADPTGSAPVMPC